jgi:hypothetical protein
MAKLFKIPTPQNDVTGPFKYGASEAMPVREVEVKGPCVISGVQTEDAEELVHIAAGKVDVFEVDGHPVKADFQCVAIAKGQRYHLQVANAGTVKIVTAIIPGFLAPEKAADLKRQFLRLA